MDRQGIITIAVIIPLALGLAFRVWGSQLVHTAGMVMIHAGVSLPQAVAWCGNGWRYACVHGAVMEYSEQPTLALCDQFAGELYQNCLHGIGHAFVQHNDSTLPELVALCADQTACMSGVYMEYPAPLPCNDLAVQDQAYCRSSEQYYAMMGLW